MPDPWITELVIEHAPAVPYLWGHHLARELTAHLHRINAAWVTLAEHGQSDAWGGGESLAVVCQLLCGTNDAVLLARLAELVSLRSVALGRAAIEHGRAEDR